jgi:hypothetical protein
MDEHQVPKREKRLDLQSETGLTRRDLLRRGAIVGGTLVWVAPAIQSVGSKALAQEVSPTRCAACYCWRTNAPGTRVVADRCFIDNITQPGFRNQAECDQFCKDTLPGNDNRIHGDWCSGTINGECRCRQVHPPGSATPGEAVCS